MDNANPETRIFCCLDGMTPAVREQKRLAALTERGLLKTETIAVFDEAAQTAARLLDAPICILGVMAQNHLHIKSAIGLSRVGLMNQLAQSRLLPRSESFCGYVVDSHQVVAIHDTATHPVFAESLLVGHYGIRAYLGAPLLTADGLCLGALAVMDLEARLFSAKDIELLAIIARWSLSEFERNRFLQKEYTNPIYRLSEPSNESIRDRQRQQEEEGGDRVAATGCNSLLPYQPEVHSANSIKAKLLTQLTQELRTPLTSVMGMASVLNRQVYGPLTTKQKEYLEIIHRSGQHLVSLVDEIVDLGSLDEIGEQLHLSSVDMEMLGQQAINSLVEIAQSRQQEIRLSVEPGSRIWLLDKEKVRHILYYLIYCVIHLAEVGSEVRIHTSRKIDLEMRSPASLQIAVWVSHPWLGEGLPHSGESVESLLPSSAMSALSNALEPPLVNSAIENWELASSSCLSPANLTSSNASLSVGLTLNSEPRNQPNKNVSRENLGLLLSCHLVELHGGQITVQGSLEAGYRYVVTLPQLEPVDKRL